MREEIKTGLNMNQDLQTDAIKKKKSNEMKDNNNQEVFKNELNVTIV